MKAARDEDAGVWIVECSDVEGLWVEGDTFEKFCCNVSTAIADLWGEEAEDIPMSVTRDAGFPPPSS